MSLGTLLVLIGLILAVVALFVSNRYLLPASVIAIAIGVLVGAGSLVTS